MNIFLRIIMLVLIALIPVIVSTSCSKEDDVEEIFSGKTFYIHGATIDGKTLNDEVKQLYEYDNSYYIAFAGDGSFTARLAYDCSLSGSWSADGHERTISFDIAAFDNPSASALSNSLRKVISDARTYTGDANVITIKADSQNFIRLSTQKK